MSQVSSIPGLGKASSELLEVAGCADLESLGRADVDELVRELKRANGILKISKRAPRKADVAKWVRTARNLAGIEDEPKAAQEEPIADAPPEEPVNYEALAGVREMLVKAPIAVPLSAIELMAHEIRVADIPPAILLNSVTGDLSVRTTTTPSLVRATRTQVQNYVKLGGENTGVRKELDTSKIRSIEEMRNNGTARPLVAIPAAAPPMPDRVALLRAPREETNRGRDPHSRRYIRGVLHNRPLWISSAALVTLCCYVFVPLAVVAGVLLLLSKQMPVTFFWVPAWILVFPLLLPVLGVLYAILAPSAKCRVCAQKLFVPRQCRKNAKAHHIRGLGYIVSLCLHILLFRWFRCSFCGTPVRLKE
jgi:hypothetical protein